ncbi:major centromere autoantigen B-like [Papaver somniferum]|uniref:major centromere autoantigen B-like n=1 Tax=Papaver somniferum TaxID=3469 RepID=UPI000E6FA2A1|nr:major centromere autoantigen B-like [Papaver somniferum]
MEEVGINVSQQAYPTIHHFQLVLASAKTTFLSMKTGLVREDGKENGGKVYVGMDSSGTGVEGGDNRRASEIADRQREEEERKRREYEETESMFDAWLPKHYERSDRKTEEMSERHQKDPKYGIATESDSEEDSAAGYEYHVEEVNTSEEGSDVVEDRLRMEKYLDWKLRRRFEFELANPKIFARTIQEGEPKVEEEKLVLIHPRTAQVEDSSDSDENLPDASNDDEEEEDESDEEDSSSGNSDTSPLHQEAVAVNVMRRTRTGATMKRIGKVLFWSVENSQIFRL